MKPSARDLFLPHAGPHAAALALDQRLDGVLAALWDEARRAHPAVTLAPSTFFPRLAQLIARDDGAAPMVTLQRLRAGDLYLACACALGDPEAVATFERLHVSGLRMPGDRGGAVDDFRQALRTRLLVGEDGRPPRIDGYDGRGALAAWVRVAAARLALNLREAEALRQGKPLPEDDQLPGVTADPELAHFRSHYREAFTAAFEATVRALPVRDRAVIRMYYLDGLGAEQIGGLYGASKRSVQRWISEVRQAILDETRRLLVSRLPISSSQIEAVMALLHHEIDVTISRLLDDDG